MRKILLSPHNDDAVLFCSFPICENPDMLVVTVFDSYVQPNNRRLSADEAVAVGPMERRREDRLALIELRLQQPPRFAGLRDDRVYTPFDIMAAIDFAAGTPDWSDVEVWAPMYHDGGHDQHNAVNAALTNIPESCRVNLYTTYSRWTGRVCEAPGDQTQTPSIKVIPDPEWITRKLRAMACYRSQIEINALGCWPWFMDLQEYVA